MNMRILGWACALLCAGAAHAQTAGVITFSSSPTSGLGMVTPKLTWSTTPAAASCTASGGWSGTKAASGSVTLTAVRANTNYTLTCNWGTVGSATLAWNTPTRNSDGTTLTDLTSFKVYYGTSSTALTKISSINDPSARGTTLGSLTPATWYFNVHSVNSKGVESADSNTASKTIKYASAAKTVSVRVTPLTTMATNVWDIVKKGDGTWGRRAVVGIIALGKPCDPTFKVGTKHYRVARTDITKIYATPVSTTLVVNCIGD
jgi:hypothetical protein